MPRFAVVLREDDNSWSKMTQDEQQRMFGLYGEWVEALRGKGAFVSGVSFGGRSVLLRGEGGSVTESPWPAGKQVLTGYFVVEAADAAAAVALARGCPALLHGESVEVRPIGGDA